jgi:hypothetical protein
MLFGSSEFITHPV